MSQSRHRAPLAGDVAQLSAALTCDQAQRRSGYLNQPAARRAYLGHYAPLNAARVALLVERLAAEGHLVMDRMHRVADLGAGPLSALLGLVVAGVEVTGAVAVDLSRAALADGEALLAATLKQPVPLRVKVADLRDDAAPLAGEGPFDLVVMANALGELKEGKKGSGLRHAVLEGALAALAPGGRVLVVEPATRKHSRALQEVRDRIVEEERAIVLSPCPRVLGCPLLGGDDWCHQDLPWRRPKVAAELERQAGLDNRRLQLSHLLLARPRDGAAPPSGFRVLSDVMGREPRRFRLACSDDGLVRLGASGSGDLPRSLAAPARGGWLEKLPDGVKACAPGQGRATR